MQQTKDWWRGAVIYQIYPRSFMDSNGDGIGDLPGITARLEHVASLGVDAIWISPFFRSPMKDFGYDVSDYRDVDPIFGTLADFDQLLARAHQLGLRILIDQVLSHTSDQHAWFQQSRLSRDNPRSDWYVWADARPDGTPPNNWLSVFGGSAWQWDARRRQYYLHSFLASQPDLNFHCPAVQEALLGEVRFWCEKGVDGFRFDACNHQVHDALLRDNPPVDASDGPVSTVQADNPYAMQRHLHDKSQPENLLFLERVRAVLDEFGASSIGEVGDEQAPPLMALYTEAGRRLHMAYSFSLLTRDGSAAHVRREVGTLEREIARTGGWGCWALSNHDVPRIATRWSADGTLDARRSRLLLAMLLGLRGSVCLYQGEELGLPEAQVPYELLQDPYGLAFWPEFKGRDGCRTPMPWQADAAQAGFTTGRPWLPVSAAHQALAVDLQEADPDSMLQASRALLAWRRSRPELVGGAMQLVDLPEPLLALERSVPPDQDGGRCWLVFNLGDEARQVALPAPWAGEIAAGLQVAPIWPAGWPEAQQGCCDGSTLTLPPLGAWLVTVRM
ncbi:alpha-glucosidase [Sphaerotilus hippei]|uniref:Alpha-glucosidase n=1 Tax=Sphaerotilus hippei TaxID=744406 RepID=A0A318HBD9_9BURK|nr:alpha-amylase family glycosyl hydrolase [Sphaerotilus hippei]PXW98029.1 alpha-glucosidase [Sphaerotilus hippei]